MLEGMEIGYDDSSSAGDAQQEGLSLAIEILAFSGNTWPDYNPELKKMIAGRFLSKVRQFSFAARRYMDIKNIHDAVIDERRWRFPVSHEVQDLQETYNLRKALGQIIHARELKAIIFGTGERVIYPNYGDAAITHITVRSDMGPKIRICPFGMATAFLSNDMHNR